MRGHSVRPARAEDHSAIAAFTTNTFAWGDYVAGAFLTWLADESTELFVAVDDSDQAIAVARVVALSQQEVWLHAARVHPDHRRTGIGTALNAACVGWGRQRGAVVAGLMTEDTNAPAMAQVSKLGYRKVANWFYGWRTFDAADTVDPGATTMDPEEAPQPLNVAPPVDIEPAYLTWSGSELATAAHGMYPIGWQTRRMGVDDLVQAVEDRSLYEAPSGWVVMIPDDEGSVRVPWIVTIADDAYSFIRAISARVAADGHSHIGLFLPKVPWLEAAAELAGCTTEGYTSWQLEIQ